MTYDPISRAMIAVVGVVAVVALMTFSHLPQRVPLDNPDLRATDGVSVMLTTLETTHTKLGYLIEQGPMPRPERDILIAVRIGVAMARA